ncbi:MAG: IS110 family transposase [Pseudonocardiales bacterium]
MSLVGALFFAGIDWAARTHAVCVLDPTGRPVAAFPVEHTGAGFTGLIRRLAKLGDPAGVPVVIEGPDGRLAGALPAAGHPVVPVKPNAIKTWREGEVISGAKSGPGDAHVIAGYLRLRAHRLRATTPLTEHTTALRTVSRTRSELLEARVAATSQLSALLDAHWPGAKEVVADAEPPISLAFLTRYPSPAHATALGEKPMAAFIAGVLTALNTAIKDLDRPAAAHLHEHPDGEVFTSFPRAGLVNAAHIRAELAEHSACTGPEAIAALAGLVPITRASGQHHAVSFRWACTKRPRVALTTFAGNSRHASPRAADIYHRAHTSGKDHPHAVRILARSWVRVIWRYWIDQQPYDPTRHGGATQLLHQPVAA